MGRIYDATWGRVFAALYDRSTRASEEAGLRRMRVELLGAARGRVLELGAGTGVNLELYPGAVAELVLAEPDPHMAKRLRATVAGSHRLATVVQAPAEELPFGPAEFDTVVFTLVLCTVADPAAALAEAARVLRPGGQVLFLEHVRSEDPDSARSQDRWERPWGFLANGCHPNRDTLSTLREAPLEIEELARERLPKAAPIVEPLIIGRARPRDGSPAGAG